MNQTILSGNPVSYTHSDAADDMQCVDLGGRRSIKKKNNHLLVFLGASVCSTSFRCLDSLRYLSLTTTPLTC